MGTSKTPTILCIGKATQDVFLRDDEFNPKMRGKVAYEELPLGAKLDVQEAIFSTGGNATNVAVTFARQNLHARYMWMLGEDPPSVASVQALDKDGVDTSGVIHHESAKTSYSTILLAPSGERTILNYHGTVPHVADVEKMLQMQAIPDWVYPTSLGSFAALEKVISWAKKNDVKVMLNPAGSELANPKGLKALLADVDVLCLNKEEMSLLVEGHDLESLVRHGLNLCPIVIVSDGPNGVMASDGKVLVTAGMYEDVPVVDRTGAGDAFASGFLSQYIQGKTLKDSIIFGSANSTSVVTKIGAKEGILHHGARLHDMPIKTKEL